VVNAFKEKSDIIKPVKPQTIAKSLAIGNPADGYYAKKIIEKTGGFAESVTDAGIVEGISLLARTEGVFTETAGGVTIGTLKKLVQSGKIQPDELTVAYITGNGYKTQEAVLDVAAKPVIIEPSIAQFRDIYDQLSQKVPSPLVGEGKDGGDFLVRPSPHLSPPPQGGRK
jgi:threonine synthase